MSTSLTTIRWLSIFTGALSLFYLGHAWFEFGLGEVFHRVHEWYVGLLYPVAELLKPVAAWLAERLGRSLPVWWKDAAVLYLMLGGATAKTYSGTSRTTLGTSIEGEARRIWQRKIDAARQRDLFLTPVRWLGWPLFWAVDLLSFVVLHLNDDPHAYRSVRYGYIFVSLLHFSRIVIGALAFAGLNAGLG